jgi:hypothetical protein
LIPPPPPIHMYLSFLWLRDDETPDSLSLSPLSFLPDDDMFSYGGSGIVNPVRPSSSSITPYTYQHGQRSVLKDPLNPPPPSLCKTDLSRQHAKRIFRVLHVDVIDLLKIRLLS